jgi:hypothetical protein
MWAPFFILESKVCPGLGRKPTRVDQFYELSGAAGGTYTVTSRALCEKRKYHLSQIEPQTLPYKNYFWIETDI